MKLTDYFYLPVRRLTRNAIRAVAVRVVRAGTILLSRLAEVSLHPQPPEDAPDIGVLAQMGVCYVRRMDPALPGLVWTVEQDTNGQLTIKLRTWASHSQDPRIAELMAVLVTSKHAGEPLVIRRGCRCGSETCRGSVAIVPVSLQGRRVVVTAPGGDA